MQEATPSAAQAMVPSLRRLAPQLVVAGVLPVVGYSLLRPHVGSDAVALAAVMVFPVAEIAFERVRHGRFEPIGMIALIGIAVGLVGAVALHGSATLLKVRESLLTGLFGAVCLGSLVAKRPVRVVEFFYAEPDAALIARVHEGGALAAWQVGSLDEAQRAVDAGCDFIVAQGTEAGGHVRGQVSLLPLLDSVLDAVAVPVVAAGGIGTPRAMAAALAAGAAGVRVGTRFVATHEADSHPAYVEALVRAEAADTIVTTAFSVMWPDAPHRVLRSCVEAAEALEVDIVGEMPMGVVRMPLPKFAVPCPTREMTGTIGAMALYAGESVGAVTGVQSAGELVRELADGAERLLRVWA